MQPLNFKLGGLAIDGGSFCHENGLSMAIESVPIGIKELVCCPISVSMHGSCCHNYDHT